MLLEVVFASDRKQQYVLHAVVVLFFFLSLPTTNTYPKGMM